MTTEEKIIQMTQRLFARRGYDGVSMRLLAERLRISPSVIYHYFTDKDVLLKTMYEITNKKLGEARATLPLEGEFSDLLNQRIIFQFQHMQEIVAVLKYYLHFRNTFLRTDTGKLPIKAILHIEEILTLAVKNKEYKKMDIIKESKLITHLINGFILELFPSTLAEKELNLLAKDISEFILRSLSIYQINTNKK
jgi:AcrR family transcriptional regulator